MAIRKRLHELKEKIKKHATSIQMPILLMVVLLVAIAALFIIGFKFPFAQSQGNDIVDMKVKNYIELYIGLINITVHNKTLSDNVWTASVTAYAPDGIVSMDVLISARDFSVMKIYQQLSLPSIPNTLISLGKGGDCKVGDKTTIDIYMDPYDPWTQKHDAYIVNFTSKFKDSIRLTYRILPTYSYDAVKDTNSSVLYAFKYLECAKGTQYFESIKQCIYSKYSETGEFLTENETKSCVGDSDMSLENASECANGPTAIGELSTDDRFASSFLGGPETPVITIDCKYKTYPLFVEKVFCYLNPKLDQCKEEIATS